MAKMVLKTVEEINSSRKRTRLIFGLAILPIFIVAVFLGVKAGVMYYSTYQATEMFKSAQTNPNDSEVLLNQAEKILSPLENELFAEKWVTSYNYGTVLVAKKDTQLGISHLEKALQEINPSQPEICLVYANLAIGYEQAGDEAKDKGDVQEAQAWYDKSLLLIETSGSTCTPPPSDSPENQNDNESPEAQGGQSLQETENRVQSKQDELNEKKTDTGNPGSSSTNPESSDTPTDDKVKEIQGQLDDSQENRFKDSAGDKNNGSQTWDKPW